MLNIRRLVIVVFLGLVMVGCKSQFNAAMTKLNTTWKGMNDQFLLKEGRRTFDVTLQQAFAAVQTSVQRLGMVIEKQDVQTGFMLVTAPAPAPLTGDEWAVVQETDTPKMRTIIEDEIGALSWLAKLDPSNRDILANVFVTDKTEGVEVTIGFRIQDSNPTTGRAKRMQAPPTAVRIGIRKFWSVFDEEIAVAVKKSERLAVDTVSPPLSKIPPGAPAPPTLSASKGKNPEGVAVIIGNKHYVRRVPNVDYAHNDADAMKRFVVNRLGFQEDNVIDLRDSTLAEMRAVFGNDKTYKGRLWRWVRPRESDVVVFYSGHGVPGLTDGREYLLPVNAAPEAPESYAYPLALLYSNLAKLEARSVTVILDTSFSGDSPNGLLIQASTEINVMSKAPGVLKLTVLTAAQGNQMASWDEETQHGLFTRYLLQALNGAADGALYGNGDSKVTINEIKSYLDREMTYAARRQFGREQMVTAVGELDRVMIDLVGHRVDKQ